MARDASCAAMAAVSVDRAGSRGLPRQAREDTESGHESAAMKSRDAGTRWLDSRENNARRYGLSTTREEMQKLLESTGIAELARQLRVPVSVDQIDWAKGAMRVLETLATRLTLAHYRSRQPVQTTRPIEIDADPKADQSPRKSKPNSSHMWEVCLPVWGPVVGRLSLVELVTHLVRARKTRRWCLERKMLN